MWPSGPRAATSAPILPRGTRLVLDHELLAEARGKPLRHLAGRDIRCAAGDVRHDDSYRPIGILCSAVPEASSASKMATSAKRASACQIISVRVASVLEAPFQRLPPLVLEQRPRAGRGPASGWPSSRRCCRWPERAQILADAGEQAGQGVGIDRHLKPSRSSSGNGRTGVRPPSTMLARHGASSRFGTSAARPRRAAPRRTGCRRRPRGSALPARAPPEAFGGDGVGARHDQLYRCRPGIGRRLMRCSICATRRPGDPGS